MGVDLFFVISGFLITGILLDARSEPSRFFYAGFYARRVLRIVPAYVLVVATLVALPSLTAQTWQAHLLLIGHEAWYWSFLVNVLVATYGWAAVIPQTAPLWSLAVEEQFYLIWPSVVRRLSPSGVLRLGLVLVVAAGVVRAMLAGRGVSAVSLYVSMPTRADALAWGAVLAALVRLPNGMSTIRRALWPTLLVASVVLIAVVLRFRSSYYWSVPMVIGGYPAVAAAATCLVAVAIVHDPGILRMSWLTRIGKVSYGLYLWHVTAIEIVARFLRDVSAWLIPLSLLVSLVPTVFSWFLVERPALSFKRLAPMKAAGAVVEPVSAAVVGDGEYSGSFAETKS
jgi:peptidoglycan/LPS O-acetylase OafA/YrhL